MVCSLLPNYLTTAKMPQVYLALIYLLIAILSIIYGDIGFEGLSLVIVNGNCRIRRGWLVFSSVTEGNYVQFITTIDNIYNIHSIGTNSWKRSLFLSNSIIYTAFTPIYVYKKFKLQLCNLHSSLHQGYTCQYYKPGKLTDLSVF